jgi:hypothetical protein
MREANDPRSITQLLSDLTDGVSNLLRKEAELIRAEIAEKITQVEVGAGSLVGGVVCLLVALNVLAGALVIALSELIGAGWAALLVGVVIAVIGVVLLKKGSSDMKNLAPERFTRQTSRDAQLVKDQVQ